MNFLKTFEMYDDHIQKNIHIIEETEEDRETMIDFIANHVITKIDPSADLEEIKSDLENMPHIVLINIYKKITE